MTFLRSLFRSPVPTFPRPTVSPWVSEDVNFTELILFFLCFQVFEDVHLAKRPTLKEVLDYLNIVFAVVFALEFLLKILGLGFLTYFKNAWNCLDVIIVAVSIKGSIHLSYTDQT